LETIKEERDGEIKSVNGDHISKNPISYFLQKRYSEKYIKKPPFSPF
jgi:hypothetical protein